MYKNCMHFRIRNKKGKVYYYCILKKKEVLFSCYQECDKKKYKTYKPIKKRTYKQSKKEIKRFSIIYQDLSKCCVDGCNTPFYQVEKNEVFEGSYRSRSIQCGAVCPFCKIHHDIFHSDRTFNLYYKVMFQREFVKIYSLDCFLKIFGQNYEYIYKKIRKDID